MINGWGELPTVVLLELYPYLPIHDRLNASSICSNWRDSVFQVPLRDTLNLNISIYNQENASKVQFLSSNFAHKVSHVTLKLDPTNPNGIALVSETLEQLAGNIGLKTLKIQYAEEQLTKQILYSNTFGGYILREYFVRKIVKPLLKVLKSKNCLEYFSFPLIQELTHFQNSIHSALTSRITRKTLQSIFLSTVRSPKFFMPWTNEPIDAAVLTTPPFDLAGINSYLNLQMLSLNHEIISDGVLSNLGVGSLNGGLKQLNLIAVIGNENVSNKGWSNFVSNNPSCKVRLTVMGSGASVDLRSNFIFPSMPLTHFKALYCKDLKITALNSIVLWNESTLEHLELINENCDWMDYLVRTDMDEHQFIDPLIYAAWRCVKLHTLKIRFIFCGENLVGIARLKGDQLKCLEIPKSQVVYHNMHQLSYEISKALGRSWKPIEDGRVKTRDLKHKMSTTARALVLDEN